MCPFHNSFCEDNRADNSGLIVPRNGKTFIQNAVTDVERWSNVNKLQLNADKCKEMVIDFKRQKQQFDAITINSKELELVSSAKVLGVIISSSLQWVDHVNEVIKKANKHLYFLILLKRANVPACDIVNFYCTVIRPVLEYCAPVFHHDLERIQKRALSIISSGLSYTDNLMKLNISSLRDRRLKLCKKLFQSVISDTEHKLHHLLPPKNTSAYNLRRQRSFDCPTTRTNRFRNTFVVSMSKE